MRRVHAVLCLALILAIALPLSAAEPDPHEGIWLKHKACNRLLRRSAATNDQLLEALGALEREYRALPDEAEIADDAERKRLDKLKDAIEKTWIRALTLVKTPPRMETNLRTPVQIRAAQLVARSRPCIDARYRRALERGVLGNKKYVPAPALYHASFAALVALDQPKLVAWFLDHAVQAQVDSNHQALTLAAFDALMSMRDVPGLERREVVRKCVAIFQSYAFHWRNEYDAVAGFRSVHKLYAKVAGVATPYWMDVRPTLLETLRHFCTDPLTGLPPIDKKTGREVESLPRYLNWFATAQRPAQPPWRDPKSGTTPPLPKRSQGRYVRPTLPLLFHQYGTPWEFWWSVARDPTRPRARASSADLDTAPSDAFRVALRQRLAKMLPEYLDDEAPRVRAAAASALAMVGAPDAATRLVGLVETDEMPVVREAAMLGLMLLHPKDQAAWFQARVTNVEECPRIRAYATLALGWLRESPFLWELVRAKERRAFGGEAAYADIRACAVFALGLAGEPDAAEPLAKRLASGRDCPAVLSAIGAALARLDEPSVVKALLGILADRRKTDSRHVAQVSAAVALGALIDHEDRASLRTLQHRLTRSSEQFGGVRSQIALSLGRVGGETATRILEDEYEDCVKSTTRVAERGFFLLGFALLNSSSGRHRVRTQLTELDHDKDLGAAAAAVTLGNDRMGLARVSGRLDATGPNFTPYAIEAIGRLGPVSAVGDVRHTLTRRHDPRVVRAGGLALARLLGPAALPDIQVIWDQCHAPVSYNALAWACHHMPSGEAETWLHSLVKTPTRRATERAYAIVALARMAAGEQLALSRVFSEHFNPYGEAPTLSGLALRNDAAFLE